MSRVFVIQATRHQADVSPAKAYGEIHFLLGTGDRTSCSPEQVRKKLLRGLEDFSSTEDYLLWAGGDPLSLMLTASVLFELEKYDVRYLRYERPDGRDKKSTPFYVPVDVEL